ncbi:nicotinate phosphoribosyltransferase [Pseudarthrobacter sp. W1I19]|nr:nicotinate phosphoribosyltransferase [Pseudarthrobacter sp. W1I19]
MGPHRRGPRGEAKRDVGAGGWAHTGEGPAAKRSETWEPVGTRVTSVSTSAGWDHPRTSFYTDHYELTMLQASLHSGAAHRKSIFEAFARRLPDGRRYGIVAGTGRLLEGIANFRFGEAELDFLSRTKVVNEETLEYLASYRFSGDIWGYPEGEAYFPYSPILIVESTFAEACMLETYLLSVLNHDSAIASAASRMVSAAGGRPCIEMGSRRTHEEAATASARAAIIAGFDSTSNLEAGIRYGVKTVGTAAHSFTLLHDTERDAFEAQIASLGEGTSLLVDTYDVETAVRAAVDLAGPRLGAVRLDSGDLVAQAQWVRQLLDQLGNENTKIVVTSDLDEFAIAALQSAPVDSYGVGTSLVTGSGAPTASMVYKLVSRTDGDGNFVSVAKAAKNKASVGGRKYALRKLDERGIATAEVVGVGHRPEDDGNDRPLLQQFMKNGELMPGWTGHEGVVRARRRHAETMAELPAVVNRLQRGEAAIPTHYEEN